MALSSRMQKKLKCHDRINLTNKMWVQYAPNLLKPKKCLWVGNDSRKSPSRVIFPSGCSRIDQGFMHPKFSEHFPKKNKTEQTEWRNIGRNRWFPPIVTSLVRNAAAAVAPGPSGPINGRRPRTSRGWHGHGGWHGWHMVSICEYHLSESIRIYPLSSQKQCDSPTKPADSPPAEQLSSNSKWQQDINS